MTEEPHSRPTVDMAAEFGSALVSGGDGARARESVVSHAMGSPLCVDFACVEMITPGFADEFFARLPAELTDSGRIKITGLAAPLKLVGRFAMSRTGFDSQASAA